MVVLGIDIGTTQIKSVLLDVHTKTILGTKTLPNNRMTSSVPSAYIQDPATIEASVRFLISHTARPIDAITITGQVHGLLYYDASNEAVSPLYTWLDGRSDVPLEDGKSPISRLYEKTGCRLKVGYALATHYAMLLADQIPPEAVGYTGILEYITSKLIHTRLDETDESSLAAFGAYTVETHSFDEKVLREVHPDSRFTPMKKAPSFSIAGKTKDGVKVTYPIGDNQAGFIGSVPDHRTTCFLSIGTSGQLSVFTPKPTYIPNMELRPYFDIGFLQVGATLSAGKAYETVCHFIQSILNFHPNKSWTEDEVYTLMEHLALEGESFTDPLILKPTFNGTRADAQCRGSLENIGFDNLTPHNLVRATIEGIVEELYAYAKSMKEEFKTVQRCIATGGALKRSRAFQKSVRSIFNMSVDLPAIEEGPALGAAMHAAIALGSLQMEQLPLFLASITYAT